MDYGNLEDINYCEYIESVFYEIDDHIRKGFDYFISGGAIGVDMDFAEYIQHMKFDVEDKKYKDIQLEIAVPCPKQDLKWKFEDKQSYALMIERADMVTQVSDKYTPSCMQKRNEYMVNKADKVIAFWNGEEHGGTWNTIQYCRKIGKEIEIIDLSKMLK